MLGCGVRPVHPDDDREWDAGSWVDAQRARGLSRESIEAEAPEEYAHANRGGVFARCGWFWDCCPRWYSRSDEGFANPAAHLHAEQIIRLRREAKKGVRANLGEQLTGAGAWLLGQADALWDHLQGEYEKTLAKQAAEDAKRNAGGGAESGGRR